MTLCLHQLLCGCCCLLCSRLCCAGFRVLIFVFLLMTGTVFCIQRHPRVRQGCHHFGVEEGASHVQRSRLALVDGVPALVRVGGQVGTQRLADGLPLLRGMV